MVRRRLYSFQSFLFVGIANGPGIVFLTGLVGHHSRFACHLYCRLPGRHKPGAPTYYPALDMPQVLMGSWPGISDARVSTFVIPHVYENSCNRADFSLALGKILMKFQEKNAATNKI
ncbi:hypothetical protein BDR07DRAFT_1321245 [Suillus spraguei]|nr:hypothetical protein BDR07DRAFT_1321245 [Suillus spraguei]